MDATLENGVFWTPARNARLSELWELGVPMLQIAENIGLAQRDRLSTKARKLGLPRRSKADNLERLASAYCDGRLNGVHLDLTRWPLVDQIKLQELISQHKRSQQPLSVVTGRQGQSSFRSSVLANYEHRCCITDCNIASLVEAAHIVPFSLKNDHDVSNGIALRVDLHRLFDRGLIAINPRDLTVIASSKLASSEYTNLHGRTMKLADVPIQPSRQALHWHRTRIFDGSDADEQQAHLAA